MSTEQTGKQASLFPEVELPVIYEQPLTERIRNCLRLEHLFRAIESGIQGCNEWNTRDTLTRMLEVCDFMVRTDIKGELIKELERNASTLSGLRSNPGVDPRALDGALQSITNILAKLKPSDYQPGSKLRNDELVNQVRQRINIPGGTCSFDVPALHYWLHTDSNARIHQLNDWMQDLRVVERAASNILKLIRESSTPAVVTASGGFYQQQIDASLPCQIVRVVMSGSGDVYPEISGGKHRFTIRFYSKQNTAARAAQVSEDVRFELQCCGI